MSVFVPFFTPPLEPEERPPRPPRPRIGRHEPLHSSTSRIVGVGAAAGAAVAVVFAAVGLSVGAGGNVLLASAQAGALAGTAAASGAWAERRRMARVAHRISDLAVLLAAEEHLDAATVRRLLAAEGGSDPELAAATRQVVGRPDGRPAARLLGRVASRRGSRAAARSTTS